MISGYFICKVAAQDDECSLGTHDCDPNGICNNNYDSFSCDGCLSGFTGSGIVGNCSDINECLDPNLHNCDLNAACSNLVGSFSCLCNHGFSGSGIVGDCQRIPCFDDIAVVFPEINDFNGSSCIDLTDLLYDSKTELEVNPSCIPIDNISFVMTIEFSELKDCDLFRGAVLSSYTGNIHMLTNGCWWYKECKLINSGQSKVCRFNCYNDFPHSGSNYVSFLIKDDILNLSEPAKLCEIDITL